MNHSINKSFEFCYGHRVWNQQLTQNQICKCRRLHSHESCVEIELKPRVTHWTTNINKLIRGMVLDFNELKPVKEFIDSVIDHRFIMDISDPLLNEWLLSNNLSMEDLSYDENDYWSVYLPSNVSFMRHQVEWLESLVVVDFVPTSEKLSEWLCQRVLKMLKLPAGFFCQITWHESAKSCAIYGEFSR